MIYLNEPANFTQEELDALETITSAEWLQSICMQSAALWSSSPDDTLEDLEARIREIPADDTAWDKYYLGIERAISQSRHSLGWWMSVDYDTSGIVNLDK